MFRIFLTFKINEIIQVKFILILRLELLSFKMNNQFSRSGTNYSNSSIQQPFSDSNIHLKIDKNPRYYVNTNVIDSVVTSLKYDTKDGSKNAYNKLKKSRFNWQLNEFDDRNY